MISSIAAVGHRIVHGGPDYAAPVLIDEATLAKLRALIPLAPLHQPHNVAGVEAARKAFPSAPQVACFDTAFHRAHPFIHDTYALPRPYYDEGVRRYGFHGLSYEFIAGRLRAIAPDIARKSAIIAHLGNGASMCAIRDGRAVATTMGFTALDGLAMGTRCGQIDPGVALYLMAEKKMSVEAISDLLWKELGAQGHVGDVAGHARARSLRRARGARRDRLFRLSRPARTGRPRGDGQRRRRNRLHRGDRRTFVESARGGAQGHGMDGRPARRAGEPRPCPGDQRQRFADDSVCHSDQRGANDRRAYGRDGEGRRIASQRPPSAANPSFARAARQRA